jgi:hypothetical protein
MYAVKQQVALRILLREWAGWLTRIWAATTRSVKKQVAPAAKSF